MYIGVAHQFQYSVNNFSLWTFTYLTEPEGLKYYFEDNVEIDFEFKNVLRREMRAQGISTFELSQKVNVPNTTLKNWLEGGSISAKNFPAIKSLAEYFGISVSTLLFNKPDTGCTEIMFKSQFSDNDSKYVLTIERVCHD